MDCFETGIVCLKNGIKKRKKLRKLIYSYSALVAFASWKVASALEKENEYFEGVVKKMKHLLIQLIFVKPFKAEWKF